MKQLLFDIRKKLRASCSLYAKRLKRKFSPSLLKDPYSVPVIINNRNRYGYLLQLISWLEKSGYTNIVILDNDSTYPPLLNYYAATKHRVIKLGANVGFMALWKTSVFDEFKNSYYVYTDPDVIPNDLHVKDVVKRLFEVLHRYPQIEKAGVALRMDDVTDVYAHKQEVLRIEKEWWKKEIQKDIFDAPVDTTFALYRPFAEGNAEECPAYRVAGPCLFRHLPWYEDSAHPTEEDEYYRSRITKESSYWLNIK